jgi:hypothetical protein
VSDFGATSYPLAWPPGRPRTKSTGRRAAPFRVSLARARDTAMSEVRRLGASRVVLSSNIPLRRDGLPYAGVHRVDDPGVALYFHRQGQDLAFACDRWDSVADNMRAIALTIGALRGIARWGTGDMLRAAFAGFKALPPPSGRPWWVVLFGERPEVAGVTREEIETAYRTQAKKAHPDAGGTAEQWSELADARRDAINSLKEPAK